MLFPMTNMFTVLEEERPRLFVTVNLNVSVVPPVTKGAVNVAVMVLAPASGTATAPAICCH